MMPTQMRSRGAADTTGVAREPMAMPGVPLGRRMAVFAYGLMCYAVFLATFLYAVGFLGNFAVPKSIDAARTMAVPAALAVNIGLLALFALQHSVMARPAFKRWWLRYVPAAAERSTYVLASSLALLLLFWQWQPLGGVVWNVTHPAGRAVLWTLFACGWLIVLVTTFLINHFDLFGLRQVWLYLRNRSYQPLRFVTPGPYRLVRHPLYVGWLLTFWATPAMTVAHLVFALLTTTYILVAIRFEERDLVAFHGESYAAYRRRVPMLIPRFTRGPASSMGSGARDAERGARNRADAAREITSVSRVGQPGC